MYVTVLKSAQKTILSADGAKKFPGRWSKISGEGFSPLPTSQTLPPVGGISPFL